MSSSESAPHQEYPRSLLPDPGDPTEGEASLLALTDEAHLQLLVAELCDKLHHPVSIRDYRNGQVVTNEDPIVREADTSLRMACNLLRACASTRYCRDCDAYHAGFMDVDKDSIERKLRESNTEKPPYFCDIYEKPKVIQVSDGKGGPLRPVIEYHCPMLGYRELLFPVKYQNRLCGVAFVGQISVLSEGDKEKIKAIRESFFAKNSPEELFHDYVEKFNAAVKPDHKTTCEVKASRAIQKEIMEQDSSTEKVEQLLNNSGNPDKSYYFKNFQTKADYLAFLERVCRAIDEVEKKLMLYYFKRVMAHIANSFMEDFKAVGNRSHANSHALRTAELETAWEALRKVAEAIKTRFDFIQDVVIFGDGQRLTIGDKPVKRAQISLLPTNARLSYDFSYASDLETTDHYTSMEKKEILQGLCPTLPTDDGVLILCQDIAMLLQVANMERNPSLRLALTFLAPVIGFQLARINSVIALCTAKLTKEKNILTLRMHRHENAHISTRLKDTVDRYFGEDGQRFLYLREEKRRLVVNDIQNTIWLISSTAANIGIVTGSINSSTPQKREPLNVFDMLYKWRSMFHIKLEDRNLEFIVLRKNDSQPLSSQFSEHWLESVSEILGYKILSYAEGPKTVTINSRLFELLVYNLVDNAVKYAYRGTNIYLLWRRVSGGGQLTVTSYGPQIPENDTPYELYVRGKIKPNREIQGDGLGLYVVRQVAKLLGLRVSHTCRPISRYNLPLISWYKEADFSSFQGYEKLPDKELDQYDHSQDQIVINRFRETQITEDDITEDYLKQWIDLPTWRTTFTVEVPS